MSRDSERDERIRLLTLEGRTATEISAIVGVTPRTVSIARRRVGVGSKPPSPIAAETLRAARALLDDGASHLEVSRTLPISRKSLARHFPGTAWTAHEASALARVVRAANRALSHLGGS